MIHSQLANQLVGTWMNNIQERMNFGIAFVDRRKNRGNFQYSTVVRFRIWGPSVLSSNLRVFSNVKKSAEVDTLEANENTFWYLRPQKRGLDLTWDSKTCISCRKENILKVQRLEADLRSQEMRPVT